MKKYISVSLVSLLTALFLVSPATADNNSPSFKLGPAVKACNQTARDEIKALRADWKAGKISKQERRQKMRDINKKRLACIKAAIKKHKEEVAARRHQPSPTPTATPTSTP